MDAPPDHGRQEATGCSIVGPDGAGCGLEITREVITGVEHDRDSPENRQAASTLAHNFLSYWTMPRMGRRGILGHPLAAVVEPGPARGRLDRARPSTRGWGSPQGCACL